MQALTFNPKDDAFSVKDIPLPKPKKNEVRVKVQHCAINPVDAKIKFWKKNFNVTAPEVTPWVVGLDVCGCIDALGSDVKEQGKWKVGDEVFYHGNMAQPQGGLAEYAIADAEVLFRKLKSFSSAEIASTLCVGWTAWRAIVEKLRVGDDDSLLVVGASGGVGSFAVQIAKQLLHCNLVIGVCSSEHCQYVEEIGADYTIDYKKQDILKTVMKITKNRGVTKALDAVGKGNDLVAANSLAFNGHMLALVDTLRVEAYDDAFMRNLSFHQLALGAGYRYGDEGLQSIVNTGIGFTQALEENSFTLPHIQEISLNKALVCIQGLLDSKKCTSNKHEICCFSVIQSHKRITHAISQGRDFETRNKQLYRHIIILLYEFRFSYQSIRKIV